MVNLIAARSSEPTAVIAVKAITITSHSRKARQTRLTHPLAATAITRIVIIRTTAIASEVVISIVTVEEVEISSSSSSRTTTQTITMVLVLVAKVMVLVTTTEAATTGGSEAALGIDPAAPMPSRFLKACATKCLWAD